MHQKYSLIFLLLTLTSFNRLDEKPKYLYHKIDYTSSSVKLIEWNIESIESIAYVREEVDDKGRTVELRFYDYSHRLKWTGSGFFGAQIIRFEYSNKKIIETYFSSESKIAYDFKTSEVPFRFVYHLDDKGNLKESEMIYKMDFKWTEESISETINHLEFYKKLIVEAGKMDSVFGYNYSYAKMGGVNPTLLK